MIAGTASTELISPERTIPHSLEAEAGVLGSLLIYPERIDLIRGVIEAGDYYSEAYGMVFQAIVDMCDAHQPVDSLTLAEELSRRGQYDIIGGDTGLAALAAAVPNSANLEFYAEIVRDRAKSRRLLRATTEIISEAHKCERAADDLTDWAEHIIYQVSDTGSQRDAVSLKDALKSTMAALEALHERDVSSGITGLATDYHQLDFMLGGLHQSELIIVAGRPSMGKSTLALNLLTHIGTQHKQPCALFTLEMSKENIAQNMLCAYGRLPAQKVRTGQLGGEQWAQLGLSIDSLSQAPIFIDDSPGISLGELRGKCRRLKRAHNIQLIAIDYLQLMSGPMHGRDSNRQQEISEISRGLKALARELEVPVIAVSQ
ncbi:MAG: replicative DNA helicase, partial [Planctomycetes bacterium]|nr:replicative DNA helicase [Planctomycetota bacterium]